MSKYTTRPVKSKSELDLTFWSFSLCHISTTLDKKKNYLRDSRPEECCSIVWYHARSHTISAGQKSRMVADNLASSWSLVIKHDITRLNSVLLTANLAANLGNVFFLFVNGSRKASCVLSINSCSQNWLIQKFICAYWKMIQIWNRLQSLRETWHASPTISHLSHHMHRPLTCKKGRFTGMPVWPH